MNPKFLITSPIVHIYPRQNYRCSNQNLWRWASLKCKINLLISRVLLTWKRKIKHRICIHMTEKFIHSFCIFLQECGSDWCRWRPDCATYCPASRWRLAKRRLCLFLLTQNLTSWQSAESCRWDSKAYSYESTYMVTWCFMSQIIYM